ncbi:F-box/WD repeat-containing protein 12 [Urocitellus parryii]
MACAQPEDFIYKEAAGNLDMPWRRILGPVAYVSGSRFTLDEQGKSIICIVSSMCKLYTWDVQEGTMIWSSPVQQFNITNLETLPQMHLAITADMEKTIKVWNCRDRNPLATCAMAQICFSLNAFLTKDGSFLMVCRKNATHQIASFLLPVHTNSPNWMEVSDGSIIVIESGPYLFFFIINGLMLEPYYCSQVSRAICDNMSIVRVVSRAHESNILTEYNISEHVTGPLYNRFSQKQPVLRLPVQKAEPLSSTKTPDSRPKARSSSIHTALKRCSRITKSAPLQNSRLRSTPTRVT